MWRATLIRLTTLILFIYYKTTLIVPIVLTCLSRSILRIRVENTSTLLRTYLELVDSQCSKLSLGNILHLLLVLNLFLNLVIKNVL